MGYGFISRQNVRSTVRGSELQPATTVFLGGVKVDGTTITIADGVISAGGSIILLEGQGVTIDVAGSDYTFNIGQEVNTSSAVRFSSVLVTTTLAVTGTVTLHSSTTIVGTLSVSSNAFVTSINIANQATISGNTRIFSLGVGTAASGSSGEIRATNNVTAFFSDQRLKENIVSIDNALSRVQNIRGVTFNTNDVAAKFGYTNKNTQVGVIAQEVQAILPQIVVAAPFDIGVNEQGTEYSLSGENYLTVQYDKLVPLLIEAIKELTDRVTKLESSS